MCASLLTAPSSSHKRSFKNTNMRSVTHNPIVFTNKDQLSSRIPGRTASNIILIVIVATVVPVAILLSFHAPESDVLFIAVQIMFYGTLPSAVCLAAAYLLAKGYFVSGRTYLLTAGGGLLMLGLAGTVFIAFDMFASSLAPGVAAGSVSFLISSILNFLGVLLPTAGERAPSKLNLKPILAAVYILIAAAMGALTYAAFGTISKAFFGQGGNTLLDKGLTLIAIALFSVSSVFFFMKGRSEKQLSVQWYSLGLALFAVTSIPQVFGILFAGDWNSIATLAGCLCFLVFGLVYLQESARHSSG